MIYNKIKEIVLARQTADLIKSNGEVQKGYGIKAMDLKNIENITVSQVNTIDEETRITFRKPLTCEVNLFSDGRKIKCV